MTNEELAEKAADWWHKKMKKGPDIKKTLGEGDGALSDSMVGLMMVMNGMRPDQTSKLEAFKAKLKELLIKKLIEVSKISARDLDVDYQPTGLLAQAGTAAGLNADSPNDWPWKTTMRIEDGKITIKDGYAEPWEELK